MHSIVLLQNLLEEAFPIRNQVGIYLRLTLLPRNALDSQLDSVSRAFRHSSSGSVVFTRCNFRWESFLFFPSYWNWDIGMEEKLKGREARGNSDWGMPDEQKKSRQPEPAFVIFKSPISFRCFSNLSNSCFLLQSLPNSTSLSSAHQSPLLRPRDFSNSSWQSFPHSFSTEVLEM